jgi:hypothetical protein
LKVFAVFVMMVAADAADRGCGEQPRMINQVLCVSKRMIFLLIPVLSPVGSFCPVILFFHVRSLCNLMGAAIPRLAGRNCSMLGHVFQYCFSGHS